MPIYTVALFGHRNMLDTKHIDHNLIPIIKNLMKKKMYIVFLIGRNGEFDAYVASIIKTVQHEYGISRPELNLVLPYAVSDIEYYDNYYDNILVPECVENVHPKSAITKRNR